MLAPFTSITDFKPHIQQAFAKAGWYPGRVCANKELDNPKYPPAVRSVLQELGGLHMVAHVEILFGFSESLQEHVEYFTELLGRPLYVIGKTEEYFLICLDAHGSLYHVAMWLTLAGVTFQEGLTCLLEGYMPTRGLILNEEEMVWGRKKQVITWPALPPPAPGSDPAAP